MGDILMMTCPFCGYTTPFQWDINTHLEKDHSESSLVQDSNMPDTHITHSYGGKNSNSLSVSRSSSSGGGDHHRRHHRNQQTRPTSSSHSLTGTSRSPTPPPIPPKSSSGHVDSSGSSKHYPAPLNLRPNPPSHSKRPASDPHPSSATATPHSHPADDDAGYLECPIDGCGEVVGLSDMDFHLELHSQQEGAGGNDADVLVAGSSSSAAADASSSSATATPEEPLSPRSPSYRSSRHHRGNRGSSKQQLQQQERDGKHASSSSSTSKSSTLFSERQRKTIHDWKMIFTKGSSSPASGSGSGSGAKTQRRSQPPASSSKSKRLGKAELGKYAHESKMPDWLVSLLKKGGQEEHMGMIPVLEQLLEQSSYLTSAYLCHQSTSHISKLRREGGFCGYRNMQMLISYIVGTSSQGHEHFKGGVPSVFELQEHIEDAWDNGINSYGRVETGGVRGTRKFIGTPEAQAVFLNLGIQCDVKAFKDKNKDASASTTSTTTTTPAVTSLLEDVETYFQSGVKDTTAKIHCTDLPPIYFQHRGHSLTIIGLEKQRVGQFTFTNLLVFDPMFGDSRSLTKLIGHEFRHKEPDKVLNAYRRRMQYLQRYHEFEILKLMPPHLL